MTKTQNAPRLLPLLATFALFVGMTGCQAAPIAAPTMNLEAAADENAYTILAGGKAVVVAPGQMKVRISLDADYFKNTTQKAVVADVERVVLSIRETDGNINKTLPRTKLNNSTKGTDLIAAVAPGKVTVSAAAYNTKGKLLGSDKVVVDAVSRKWVYANLTLRLKTPPTPTPAPKKTPAPKAIPLCL